MHTLTVIVTAEF